MFYLDVLGASLSLLATLLFVDARVNAWPVSLLAIIINLVLYFKAGIYGDFALHCSYLVTALYGWYCWHASDANRTPLHIHLLSNQQRALIFGFGSIATTILFLMLHHINHSNVAWLDAFTTVFSLIGVGLTSRKYLENWWVWLAVDIGYCWLFDTKGLTLHSIVHAFYIGLAIAGWYRWQRLMQNPRYPVSEHLAL